jgi:hypothetical protein
VGHDRVWTQKIWYKMEGYENVKRVRRLSVYEKTYPSFHFIKISAEWL